MSDFTQQITELIRTRRSTKPRCFNGKRIEDSLVWEILENANWAPTHGLTQPWRFKVFTGSSLEKLANFQADLYKKLSENTNFKLEKYERMKTNILKSSHVIVICMKRQISEQIPEIEEIEAVACSVQNMALTATAYGICSFWGSGGVTYTQELKDFLGLEQQDYCLGYLYLGYSDRLSLTSRRDPIKQKVEWFD
ncbi:nitroreductase [Stanieria cyanosphaera PCC 7437]|uniref:Putative NAD(P)H nitroreductase n=1 Tax=Stanieria cyanosphaera (strain ATCC 29371 / PCC 7437) TaxID=111780 RepID=K9XZ57_STAC7|nr:nitroreductase [Stanieria cyanosphaera]AFZ37803.1 nitroreductase [Stanieria cyanosphaera PCC 7437]